LIRVNDLEMKGKTGPLKKTARRGYPAGPPVCTSGFVPPVYQSRHPRPQAMPHGDISGMTSAWDRRRQRPRRVRVAVRALTSTRSSQRSESVGAAMPGGIGGLCFRNGTVMFRWFSRALLARQCVASLGRKQAECDFCPRRAFGLE
jgi:hypothetical protein